MNVLLRPILMLGLLALAGLAVAQQQNTAHPVATDEELDPAQISLSAEYAIELLRANEAQANELWELQEEVNRGIIDADAMPFEQRRIEEKRLQERYNQRMASILDDAQLATLDSIRWVLMQPRLAKVIEQRKALGLPMPVVPGAPGAPAAH